MILSIITINRNNASGLRKTMQSIITQSSIDFEYIVIDGASTDGSDKVIQKFETFFGERIKWVSEPDTGIYNAMNKGLAIATGDYIQFLNSGDCLASETIVENMLTSLKKEGFPSILYGNMMKVYPNGKTIKDRSFAGHDISMLGFYTGTLNHSPALIKRSLFNQYGKYDESLKIVSDWKWYLQAIIWGGEKPVYTDLDVSLFDMTGISETNKELDKAERATVLAEILPLPILEDYKNFSFAIDQFKRLKRHPGAYRLVWFIERVLFKIEKRQISKTEEIEYK